MYPSSYAALRTSNVPFGRVHFLWKHSLDGSTVPYSLLLGHITSQDLLSFPHEFLNQPLYIRLGNTRLIIMDCMDAFSYIHDIYTSSLYVLYVKYQSHGGKAHVYPRKNPDSKESRATLSFDETPISNSKMPEGKKQRTGYLVRSYGLARQTARQPIFIK